MTQSSRFLRSAVALGVLAACAGSALAQSTTITFQNATPPITIPLKNGSAVNIDGNGNLTAQCELSPQSGCVGASSGGTKADVLTFARTDTDPQITAGESVTIAWTTANATLCNASATPTLSGWTGLKAASGSGQVQIPAAGSYSLSLSCYNDSGSTGAKQVAVNASEGQVTPPPTGAENCTGISGPLVKPSTLNMFERTWPQAFYSNVYPSTGAPLAPVGSFTLKSSGNTGPAIAGKYITVPFTPSTGVYKMTWLQAQPIHENGYSYSRVAESVYVTISTCRGDFRLADSGSSDPLLKPACRKLSGATSMFYSGTLFAGTSCAVEVGKQYYLNFLFADPRDGILANEDTCAGSEDQCEVNFQHERQSN